MFSKSCEYGIRAAVYIASEAHEGHKVGIAEICRHIEAPRHFTAKILQTLSRRNIISSQKGINGGFYLDDSQKKKSIKEIVEAIDGNGLFTGCGLGLKRCSETKPCPIHKQFKEIRRKLTEMMEGKDIGTLAIQLKKGRVVLM
ncbi:RrF2 family transcriptional regulator [Sediminibacterium soli]|uniref:RrF2 family transcriptional regulator n=1 Tax=Sediminibacterium soli TaxID=2698829 RepID=UPI00137B0820|nr:Rrf2 family transcriptional regulator [Sediminibacterium soli]NCI46279.1 Rrf2 family transcriptional regulator [Sediminibacterium soli]